MDAAYEQALLELILFFLRFLDLNTHLGGEPALLDLFWPIFELVRDVGVSNTFTKSEENLQTPSKIRALTRRAAGGGGARFHY